LVALRTLPEGGVERHVKKIFRRDSAIAFDYFKVVRCQVSDMPALFVGDGRVDLNEVALKSKPTLLVSEARSLGRASLVRGPP